MVKNNNTMKVDRNQKADMNQKVDSSFDTKDPNMNFKSIMKDIEFFSSTHMTWKEKKEMENRKVLALGGKAPKNHRLPLNIARVMMKKQKERDERMQEQNMILKRFGGKSSSSSGFGSGSSSGVEKRKPEDRALKTSEGRFRNGVLDVKHLLRTTSSREASSSRGTSFGSFGDDNMMNKGKKSKQGGGKKNKGKKKGGGGGGKKRH